MLTQEAFWCSCSQNLGCFYLVISLYVKPAKWEDWLGYFLLIDSVFWTSFILLRNFCFASYSSVTLMTISDAENITSLTSIGGESPKSSPSIASILLKVVLFL